MLNLIKIRIMGKYLDFDKQEKGYEKFELNTESIKANIGRQICYVNKRRIDKNRGYYNVEYGTIHGKHYSTLLIDEGNVSIDIRDVEECGIQIEIEPRKHKNN